MPVLSGPGWFSILGRTWEIHRIEIPLIFQRIGEFDEASLEHLYSFTQSDMGRPHQVLLLVAWRAQLASTDGTSARWMGARGVDLVFAVPAQIMQIMRAANPEEELRGLVLRQATNISPFVTVGPVPPSMFFGREQELRGLDYLSAGRSCAVIGGRRYGKTL